MPEKFSIRISPPLQEAIEGQEILAQYCAKKLHQARQCNNMAAFNFFTAMGDLISDQRTGLILGSIVFEMPRYLREREIAAMTDTVTTASISTRH